MFNNEQDFTYIFENQETKEIMWFMPIAKLLKFLSAKGLGFDLYNASGNTCQINGMLGQVIKENKFLTKLLPKFTNIDISRIHETLNEAPVDSRDGWQSKNNPITIIGMFNNNSSDNSVEYNREIALSCSGVKDWDMVGVIRDDFLSKYFEKATKYGKNHRELLYYRNFNIKKTGKLVTGMSNFNTEIFRSELLKQYCFLDIDMCIYNFSDYQDKNKTQALFKLIMENVFVNDSQEYNLYEIDEKELLQFIKQINQQISDFLKLANSNNELRVKYDTDTRQFLMVDEKKKSRDATAYLYTTLCDYLKKNNLAKSEGKLKEFVENENNSAMMNEVAGNHYQEKFNLVKNIAEYFESDLLDSALKAIEFTEEEKIDMKKYFFDRSPLEFFFKNPKEIEKKLSEDKNCNIENHPDKEDSITKYILGENIDDILTDQGKEFLAVAKKITRDNKYFKDRIKEDEMDKTFEQYQSQNGVNCTYKNNSPNKKTKIEFSVLKALIESLDSGSNVAYKNFFVQLSYYLNYFFCNEKNLSKKELRDSIKKEIDEIDKKISDIKQKMDAREQEIGKMADDNLSDDKYQSKLEEINKAYGTKIDLMSQLSKAQAENTNFKKTIFFQQDVKLSLEASDDNEQPLGLNKFEKYFLGYDEDIFDIVRPKIKEFVKANELFKDTKLTVVEDEARIDEKTKHLVIVIQNYLGDSKQKITYDWFNLYANYVCQHAKMEFDKIMDGVINQNDLEKNTDASLSFLITDIIIEYRKALEEIESDKTNKKLIDSCNNFGMMNLFHLWQSFINAGYIFTYDLNSDNMCEYICNAYKINLLINHHPKKLIEEIRKTKSKSIDFLIDQLFENNSLENNGQIKKLCKMSIYTFSAVTTSVDHMTQLNMAQFFSETNNVQRKFSNGVMLDKNGSLGCFMVPIQKALEICKISNPDQFKKDINEMLPKLPEGMKWANIDQECGSFLDENTYKMLSPTTVSKMFCTTKQLAEKAKSDVYLFKVLIQKEQNQFNEFLSQNSDKNSKNIFDAVIEDCLKNDFTLSIKEIKEMNDTFCFIDEIAKNATKFSLNAAEKFISLTEKIIMTTYLKIVEIESYQNNYSANDLKNYKGMITKYSIDILVNFIGKTYFAWNNVIEKSDPENNLRNKIIENSFIILNIVSEYIKRDDIIKNKDLILWLYLIYKKINFDSDFFKARNRYENPLKLNDKPHFLREYKILDGYDAISSKNIFYTNDRIQEFKEYLTKNNFSHLIFLVDHFPRDWENLTSILETKKNIGKLLKQKVESKEFVSKLWKHELSKLIKKTHNPEELFNVAQNDKNISHVFYAVKTLYKTKSHYELKQLLLSDDMETNVLKKLCMDTKIDSRPRKEKDEIDMFLDSIEIFSNLLLQKKMKISFTSAVYLIKSIANFVIWEKDADIEKCYGDICDDKYMKYFRGDKNIFSVVSEIVGQISFPANTVMSKEKPFWPNAKENLLSLCKPHSDIYYSEYQSRGRNDTEMKEIDKNLSFRLYLLYKKIFYDENNKGNLNLDDNKLLLCAYQPNDKIENIRKKYIFWDDYHVKDFYKWAKDNDMYRLCSNFYENTLSKEILIELASNHGDCEAFYYFTKRDQKKAQEYLLSSDKDNVVQKLYSLCTEKTQDDLQKLDSAIWCTKKISFRVALAAIKFAHDFHTKFRENTKTEIFKEEFDKLYPKPLDFISGVTKEIYFADEKLENYVSIDEYKDFLRIVVGEIYFYEEEVENNGIYEYFNSYKLDLIWYLYLLHRKIIDNENYIVNEQSDNVEFKTVDGNYLVGDYKTHEVLNINQITNLFHAKYMSPMDDFGFYPYDIFCHDISRRDGDNSLAKFSLQGWIRKFKLDLKPRSFWMCLKKKIRKQEFKILVKSIQEAKAKEKTKNMLKKKYYSTLAKDLKQFKALDLFKKRIIKKNGRNVTNSLKENDKKIKQRDKLKEILEKLQTKINKEKQIKTLKEWNEKNKRIKTARFNKIKPEILKKWQEIDELIKAREETKKQFQNDIKEQIQKKCEERKNKIEAKDKEKTKNMLKKKYYSTLAKNLKQLKDKIKRREKLKEILEKLQTKMDKEKQIKTLKEWNEKNKRIRSAGFNTIKPEILKKCEERNNKIKAKDKIKKIVRRDIFNKLNDKLIASAQNQNESDKQKRSNASSKIKKIIFSAVVDLILAALAIIFLEKIILILVLVVLAIIFIVCCGFAIKNGRDYKNLGTKISAFEERPRELNINQQQQIVPNHEVEQNNLIENN